MSRVVIGVDPHKASNTLVVIDVHERVLAQQRRRSSRSGSPTVNRLHDVLCQLIPGGAKRRLSATRARQLLAAVRPRDAVGKARKQLALDYLGDLERLDARLKELKRTPVRPVTAHDAWVRAGAEVTAVRRRDRVQQRGPDRAAHGKPLPSIKC